MISKILFLACFFPSVLSQFAPLTSDPICAELAFPISISGTATFVDVDGSGGSPSTGDFSIAVSLEPTNPPTPFSTYDYTFFDFNTKAICVFTQDQVAPTCFLETHLKICGRTGNSYFIGGGVDPTGPIGPLANERRCKTPVYEGVVTAHGSGPDPFAITGGTGDFFGAFGFLDGAGTFAQNGGNVGFDATFKICFDPST